MEGNREHEHRLAGAKPRLIALPRQPALQQEQQSVGERLEVVTPAGGAAQVRVHAGVAHGPPEYVRPLVVLHVGAANRIPPPRRCDRVLSSIEPRYAAAALLASARKRGSWIAGGQRRQAELQKLDRDYFWTSTTAYEIDESAMAGLSSWDRAPSPRSTSHSFFSLVLPGWPSRKFSGFTSPCTYLHLPMHL